MKIEDIFYWYNYFVMNCDGFLFWKTFLIVGANMSSCDVLAIRDRNVNGIQLDGHFEYW